MSWLLRWCYVALLLLPLNAQARQEFVLVLKDHLFTPSHIRVPAGVKIKVRLINQDPTPEEFESFALNREKVVLGNAEAILYLGPLQAGEYDFFGDFHPDSAKGILIAVPEQEWQQQQVQHVD
jgi:hypothetical protein